jgi:hypothetical protein
LSTDEIKCFHCSGKGHIRRFCPHLAEETQVARDVAEDHRRGQQNKENNKTNSTEIIPENVSTTPQNENDNDVTDRPAEESITPSKTTDTTDTPSNDITDETPIINELINETEKSSNDIYSKVTYKKKKKRKSKDNKETDDDVTNHPDNDKEPNDDNTRNINDEEVVRTHPSQTTSTHEPPMLPPMVPLSQQSSLHLSGLPDTYNPNASNSISDQDDIDNESITSDMTDLSQTDTQTHQRDPTEISDFLDDILNSKTLITKCEDFCPNLLSLAKQLKTYNRSNPDLTKNQRARIHKYVVKIRAHLKTTGKKFSN